MPPKKGESDPSQKTENTPQAGGNSYFINFLLFLAAILIGMFIQHYMNPASSNSAVQFENEGRSILTKAAEPSPSPIDMDAIYKELSEKIKKEIMDSVHHNPHKTEKKQDSIINEQKDTKNTVKIGEEPAVDKNAGVTFNKGNEPIQLDLNPDTGNIRINKEEKPKRNEKKENEEAKRKQLDEERKKREEKAEQVKKRKAEQRENKAENDKVTQKNVKQVKLQEEEESVVDPEKIPAEVKNFKSSIINEISTKKLWIPIPNSNGGHRRVPPMEVKAGKEHGSSVKMWLYEEFLSKEECDSLMEVHDSHLKAYAKEMPIVCFDSVSTLRKNLKELNKADVADLVSPNDFTEGTMCINQTFSRQMQKWGLKWSFSTAFYPGESKFSTIFGKRIEEATALNEGHGGKFQITSYPHGVGYKEHTDCVVDSAEERDRYATVLVYLNDMGADGGGETKFSELGIDVKPRQGRAITWNSMNYLSAKCEEKSVHHATKVEHQTKKKYILQRWYYYKNFYALGKRMPDAHLPKRAENTAKVNCDDYDNGGCRMYDEWLADHMLEYRRNKKTLQF